MKKAQIEIAGLLVIVVLVSLVLLFVLTFSIDKEINTDPVIKNTKDYNLKTGFGPVLLETSSECTGNSKKNMRELIIDCAYLNDINCDDKDSCTFVNETIKLILDNTLTEAGLSYIFQITRAEDTIPFILINETGCNSTVSRQPGVPTHIGSAYGSIELKIIQCT